MLNVKPLFDKKQTGEEMHRLIDQYYTDLDKISLSMSGESVPLSKLSLQEYFDMVRRIPYRRDIKQIEVVARPRKILKQSKDGCDCKKKAILMASWCKRNGLPFRLIASSRLPSGRIHHVFPQCKMSPRSEWINIDATYPKYRIGEKKKITKAEVLK